MSDLLRVAVHGLQISFPGAWEVIVNKGDWQRGQLVLANERNIPAMALSFRRSKSLPNWQRSFEIMARQLTKSHGLQLQKQETLSIAGTEHLPDAGPIIGSFTNTQLEMTHAAITPVAGDERVSLSLRQLLPGTADELREIIHSAQGFHEEQVSEIPWSIHGLDIALAPIWRLTGVRHTVGLVRGIWFRQPKAGKRADQVLTMRRFACGERLLEDGNMADWLQAHLPKGEKWVTHTLDNHQTLHAEINCPAATWLQRLRGKRRIKDVYSWQEPEMDRFVIQEWFGQGDPLPCLRRSFSPNLPIEAQSPALRPETPVHHDAPDDPG